MAVKIKRYDVAFVDQNEGGAVVEHRVEVWGVDRLRAEMEARRGGIRGQVANVRGKGDDVDVTDMGDMLNREALDLWAACVRLKLYDKPSIAWRNEDYVGSEKVKDADGDDAQDVDVDPTPSGPSTGSA